MSVTLQNERFSSRIEVRGAEIRSLREFATGIEYVWKADPDWWAGSAPILFPIVGGLKDGGYVYGGKEYAMPQHGIVRKKDWEVREASPRRAVFGTASDDETREAYPFDFDLRAVFSLIESGLDIRYEVGNTGSGTMYFSIGSHPAISLPFAGGTMENYYVHFSEEENLERYFFEGGMHLSETAPAFDNCRQIYLTRDLFERGPLIFKSPRSTDVTLICSLSEKAVRIATPGVPYLALWSKARAPFVCVEPWHGVPDNIDTDRTFETKEGIMPLGAGETWATGYRIEILG